MILKSNMNLQGFYSIDTYGKDGVLKHSTSPEKNFITNTGLSYIGQFAIADCFRYLSLGTSNTKNYVSETDSKYGGTFELSSPSDIAYRYIGGRTSDIDLSHSASQYYDASFIETTSGVRLNRSWRVPVGTDVFSADTTFEEVALSPGRGYNSYINNTPLTTPITIDITTDALTASSFRTHETVDIKNTYVGKYLVITKTNFASLPILVGAAPNGGANNTIYFANQISLDDFNDASIDGGDWKICEIYHPCDSSDSVYELTSQNEDGTYRVGTEYSPAAKYYRESAGLNICGASGAFVRIVKSIPVLKDEYFVFNYSLNVDFETGIHPFSFLMDGTRNTRAGLGNTNWGIVAGVSAGKAIGGHKLIHAGIKLITSSTQAELDSNISQHGTADYDIYSNYGESYISSWGCPLEPSARYTDLRAYLTSDNLQFVANSMNGGASGVNYALDGFEFTSGLMRWRGLSSNTPTADHINIRKLVADDENHLWPDPSDYTNGIPGEDMLINDRVINTMGATAQTSITETPVATSTFVSANRIRTKTRANEFRGASAANDFAGNIADSIAPAQIRGIVLAYEDPAATDRMIPYLDCLFKNSGTAIDVGMTMIPSRNIKAQTYNAGTLKSDYWYYLEADAKLTFSFQQSWGSPCDSSVDGCPP